MSRTTSRGGGSHFGPGDRRNAAQARARAAFARAARARAANATNAEDSTVSHVPETPTNEHIQRVPEHDPLDDTGNTAKEDLVLHPDGLWFDDPIVVALVNESWRSSFDGPYRSWTQTPDRVTRRWWISFKDMCCWDPSVADEVKLGWQTKLTRCLSNMVCKITNDPNYKARWCPKRTRDYLIDQMEKDDKLKARRAQCSANRMGRGQEGLVAHRQGSISTSYLKRKLAKEFGKEPTAIQVFKRAHGGKKEEVIDPYAKKILEKYESMKTVNPDSETQEVPETDNEIFLKAVGGWDTKGRVHGLGSAASTFFERPMPSTSRTSKLEAEVQQLRASAKEKDEAYAKLQEEVADMKKMMDLWAQRMDNCHPMNRSFEEEPPFDPSTGGGLVNA